MPQYIPCENCKYREMSFMLWGKGVIFIQVRLDYSIVRKFLSLKKVSHSLKPDSSKYKFRCFRFTFMYLALNNQLGHVKEILVSRPSVHHCWRAHQEKFCFLFH